jgi:hypothetical protein
VPTSVWKRGLGDVVDQDRRALEVDVVAEDQVLLLAAVQHVVAGAADQDVVAETAEDDVVAAVLQFLRVDEQNRIERRGLDLLRQRARQVRIRDVLDDLAVVAEDDVVEVALLTSGSGQAGREDNLAGSRAEQDVGQFLRHLGDQVRIGPSPQITSRPAAANHARATGTG